MRVSAFALLILKLSHGNEKRNSFETDFHLQNTLSLCWSVHLSGDSPSLFAASFKEILPSLPNQSMTVKVLFTSNEHIQASWMGPISLRMSSMKSSHSNVLSIITRQSKQVNQNMVYQVASRNSNITVKPIFLAGKNLGFRKSQLGCLTCGKQFFYIYCSSTLEITGVNVASSGLLLQKNA